MSNLLRVGLRVWHDTYKYGEVVSIQDDDNIRVVFYRNHDHLHNGGSGVGGFECPLGYHKNHRFFTPSETRTMADDFEYLMREKGGCEIGSGEKVSFLGKVKDGYAPMSGRTVGFGNDGLIVVKLNLNLPHAEEIAFKHRADSLVISSGNTEGMVWFTKHYKYIHGDEGKCYIYFQPSIIVSGESESDDMKEIRFMGDSTKENTPTHFHYYRDDMFSDEPISAETIEAPATPPKKKVFGMEHDALQSALAGLM